MDLKRDLSARPTPTPQWRQARLRLFLGVIAIVTTFSSGTVRAQGNSVCSRWCVSHFPPGPARGLLRPFCEFVPGTAGGRCTCVDHQCGTVGVAWCGARRFVIAQMIVSSPSGSA